MRVLYRLLMIHAGLLAACFAAAIALLLIEAWSEPIPEAMTTADLSRGLMIHGAIIAGIALFFTYLPGSVLGLLGEVFSIRSVLVYAAAGAALGLLPALEALPHWITVSPESTPLAKMPLKAYPAVGIIGGCAYWLVTGCKAGFFRPAVPTTTAATTTPSAGTQPSGS